MINMFWLWNVFSQILYKYNKYHIKLLLNQHTHYKTVPLSVIFNRMNLDLLKYKLWVYYFKHFM